MKYGVPYVCVLAFLCALVAQPTYGANILGLFSSHSTSHLIVHMSAVQTLAEAGHNITVVSMVKPTIKHKNIHHIFVPCTDEQERILSDQIATMATQKNGIFSTMWRLFTGMNVMIESQYELLLDERFKRIYETKFDLMIMGYFLNDFQLGVAAKLQVPVIVEWMSVPIPATDVLVGNPQELSYVPSIATSLPRGQVMGFAKRFENLSKHVFVKVLTFVLNQRCQGYYTKAFGAEPNFPTLTQMKRNISLLFTNSHSISEGPIRPLVPGSVEIGGIQIKDKPDPLPQDLEDFLAKAKHGAILLSLGSNVKSTAVKPELIQTMFKVLSGLKQHVIFKWEDLDNTPGKANNILFKKWLPQDDLLAHPKIKLFITHAGKGGITEAQYHGVPMVALPIFGDQNTNADTMRDAGYGVSLDLLTITEATFRKALLEVLENDKYAKAIKNFSDLYRDRPMSAKQTVVYWVEYVLRHHGAAHMQSPAVHMCAIAYHNIDVYAVLLLVLLCILLLFKLTAKFIYRKLCRKQTKVKKN